MWRLVTIKTINNCVIHFLCRLIINFMQEAAGAEVRYRILKKE